jgi:hypothetical protein
MNDNLYAIVIVDAQAHRPMSFSSEEEMQQRKMNFFSAHDVIENHNNKPGVTFTLEHNRFSTMVNRIEKLCVKNYFLLY